MSENAYVLNHEPGDLSGSSVVLMFVSCIEVVSFPERKALET